MGQYWLPVNLSKKEFIHPHRLGDGLKLWEQGASQGGTLNALHALLVNAANGRGGGDYTTDHPEFVGRWAGDRISLVGDYTESGDMDALDYGEYIYAACSYTKEDLKGMSAEDRKSALGPFKVGEWKDISDLARSFLAAQWHLEFGDDGWVSRMPMPDSVFGPRTGSMMKPDIVIGIPGDDA